MTDELKSQLDQVRSPLGPKAIGMGFAELFSVMASLSAEKLSEKKFGKSRAQENFESAHSTTPADVSPAPITPAATKHALWQRDQGRCCQCGTGHNLHIDHVNPVALGETSVIENLRLLCFSCNQRQAIKVFGIGTMERFVARGY